MTHTNDRAYCIDVPGIPAERRSAAKQDIRRLVDGVAAAAKARGRQFPLHGICVTNRFEDEVNRLLQGRSGLAGYAATRGHAQAIGKTLWTRSEQGKLEFTVVIDARQVDSWELTNARCLTTLLHELSHVLFEERHVQRLGEEEYTTSADTRERCLDRWASVLLDEFDVDRMVDSLLQGLTETGEGRTWSLQELEEAQGVDWAEGLRSALLQLPDLVEEKVWDYQIGRMKIEDLATEVIPEVKDVLILLSHTAAMYLGTTRWPDIMRDIRETEASRRFLKEHLDTILGQFSGAELPLEETIQVLSLAIEGIFRNCGLTFRTVPEGLYIAVRPPSPS